MALYAIGRQVYSRTHDAVGTIAEANYGPGRKAATYLVLFGGVPGGACDWLCGSGDLRAVDYYCDGCGQPRAGRPAGYGRDGEYERGLAFCFPCCATP
jgi:hypothetical protein